MSVLLSEGDLARLKELQEAGPDAWCRATWACSALYALRMTDDEVQANWPKLAGRRAESVRELIGELKAEKREMWQMRLSRFAKDSPVVRERKAS